MRCVVNVAMLLMTLRLTPCDVTKSYLVLRELPSVKGACDAQCEAYCQEIPDHVDECESLCRPGIPRKWIFNCQHGGDCKATGYCSVLAKQSLTGSYVPSKPVLKILRDPSTKGILLHWEEDKQTVHRVIYIVQWALNVTSVPTEDMWFTLGWTIRGSYMINDIKDACIDPWFRVAAVSRFGSRWYSKAMQTPPLDVALYPPGPVQDISVNHFTYHKDTDEITFQLFWKEPAGWERNDIISYQWTEHLDHPCLDSGQGVPIIPDARSSSNDTHVQSFRMPNIGVGCKFKFKIVAYARCNPNLVGQYNSIDVTVDCHTVKELPCPAHIYNPPGNVQNITLVVIPSVRGSQVLVCWDPPADMGSEGRVDQYHIKWGRVLYDEMLDMATLYNTSTKTVRWNVTCTTIRMGNTTTNNSDPYGVQIIASSPGHGVDSWLSPVQKVPPTDQYPSQSDWTEAHRSSSFTTVLKDSNGVVIVLVPKAKGVRLYVTKPEERSRDSLSGFFIHWGRVLNESNKLSLQDKASIFMPKNYTRYFYSG